jgi:uncharacterized protein YcbX
MLTLSQLWIYPIKSLGGIQMSSWPVEQKGFRFDRRWMLVDKNGGFMTQRSNPMMALFKLTWHQNHFNITFQGHSLKLEIHSSPKSMDEPSKIWDDAVSVREVSDDHSSWFSEMMRSRCRLMFFPEKNQRPVESAFQVNNEHVSLADAYPYLIIGQSSLDDLNTRLNEPVPMNRFRPSLVFTGGNPYEEDTWKNFNVGNNTFSGTRQCSRCILITTDQETARRTAEPLKTLAGYRSKNNKTYFGQNAIALSRGEIKVGDTISVQSYL